MTSLQSSEKKDATGLFSRKIVNENHNCRVRPGFSDRPTGYFQSCVSLDVKHWTESQVKLRAYERRFFGSLNSPSSASPAELSKAESPWLSTSSSSSSKELSWEQHYCCLLRVYSLTVSCWAKHGWRGESLSRSKQVPQRTWLLLCCC